MEKEKSEEKGRGVEEEWEKKGVYEKIKTNDLGFGYGKHRRMHIQLNIPSKNQSQSLLKLKKSISPSANCVVVEESKPIPSSVGKLSYLQFLKSNSPKAVDISKHLYRSKHFSPSPMIINNNPDTMFKKEPILPQENLSLHEIITSCNGFEGIPNINKKYKAFIGSGNNSTLIRSLFSKVKHWNITKSKSKANFVWTQWKDDAFISALPCANPTAKKINEPIIAYIGQVPNGLHLITESSSFTSLRKNKEKSSESLKMHNKLEFNNYLSNKRELYITLKEY
jgi:hypothetical protein